MPDISGSWTTLDRHFSYDRHTFTKRELFPHERRTNRKGEIIRIPWSAERLENEYAALEYIAANTYIPVPQVVSFKKIDGSFQLVVERVSGVLLTEMGEDKAEAAENAKNYITSTVLPQLASLKSNRSGNLNGVVIPPSRIWGKDKRPWWAPRISDAQDFVFCHNDLSQHNIMMDPITLEVAAIIDWEYSGFYLPEFEAPLWTKHFKDPGYHDIDAHKLDDLIKFLDNSPGMHWRVKPWSDTNFFFFLFFFLQIFLPRLRKMLRLFLTTLRFWRTSSDGLLR